MRVEKRNDGSYLFDDKDKLVCHFDFRDEVIIHRKDRKRFIKGEVYGVRGEGNTLTHIHVNDLRSPGVTLVPIKCIESMEVIR